MTSLPSSLARLAPAMRDPTSPEDMEAMRRRAWTEQGIACLPIADLLNDRERATVTTIATRLYGRRAT